MEERNIKKCSKCDNETMIVEEFTCEKCKHFDKENDFCKLKDIVAPEDGGCLQIKCEKCNNLVELIPSVSC